MQAYLLGAAGVIFLSVIVSLLIPEGKLNKTITFVIRMVCILVLIQPITKLFSFNSSDDYKDIVNYGFVSTEYGKQQSAALGEEIEKKFGVDAECFVQVDYLDGRFKVNSVEVELYEGDEASAEKIYAYLSELGYINISVYAKSV